MSISQTICDFATLAIEAGGWMEMDRLYLQNRLLGMVGEDALESIEVRPVKEESVDLLDQLVAKARENGVLSELPAEQEIFEAQLMDFLHRHLQSSMHSLHSTIRKAQRKQLSISLI